MLKDLVSYLLELILLKFNSVTDLTTARVIGEAVYSSPPILFLEKASLEQHQFSKGHTPTIDANEICQHFLADVTHSIFVCLFSLQSQERRIDTTRTSPQWGWE